MSERDRDWLKQSNLNNNTDVNSFSIILTIKVSY